MTPAEASDLLTRCAAFDNRQPSAAAAIAWASALGDIPLDKDTFGAVDRFYGTPPPRPGERLWIQPHDVRTARTAIRAERLESFVYEPANGDETPHQYLANLRVQREAVASGRRPANPAIAALEGGPHHTVAAALTGAVRTVPDDETEPDPNASPLSVPCPKCGARLGHHCRWPNETRRPTHGARKRKARGEPLVSPTADNDTAARRAAAAAHLEHLAPEERARLNEFQDGLRETEAR
jgi:hypothetical protein